MIFQTLDSLANDRECSAVTGISRKAFTQLLVHFTTAIETSQQEAYRHGDRLRSPGGGRKGNLDTNEKKLFFILFYLKTYPTFDVLGFLFDMDGGNACAHVHRLLPILTQALEAAGMRPKRVLNTPEELEKLVDSEKEILIDATERECVRPQDKTRQKASYSGKKKDILSKPL